MRVYWVTGTYVPPDTVGHRRTHAPHRAVVVGLLLTLCNRPLPGRSASSRRSARASAHWRSSVAAFISGRSVIILISREIGKSLVPQPTFYRLLADMTWPAPLPLAWHLQHVFGTEHYLTPSKLRRWWSARCTESDVTHGAACYDGWSASYCPFAHRLAHL